MALLPSFAPPSAMTSHSARDSSSLLKTAVEEFGDDASVAPGSRTYAPVGQPVIAAAIVSDQSSWIR
jgi:hypothetical protein